MADSHGYEIRLKSLAQSHPAVPDGRNFKISSGTAGDTGHGGRASATLIAQNRLPVV